MGCGGSKDGAALKKGPSKPKYKVAVVGYKGPISADKDSTGARYDSVPIANGMVNAGCTCDMLDYSPEEHDTFVTKALEYDGLILRIVPGHLSAEGVPEGTQKKFDSAMDTIAIKGKAIWSSPIMQKQMGAKDSLVKIKDLNCGLPDTFSYTSAKEFEDGFKKSCAFSPRVLKCQNRGNGQGKSGEGVWLVWLESKRYCESFGEKSLTDRDRLKLMEMNDNHVEFHTVKEFMAFCTEGIGKASGNLWSSSNPGAYLAGGKGAQIVDQRLLPRIVEGEVRMIMSKDKLHSIVHKKPKGAEKEGAESNMSAVAGMAEITNYAPNEPKYKELRTIFEAEIPTIMDALGVAGEPLPLLWTADFIPVDNHKSPYVIGELNCGCVDISQFDAAIGADLKAVAAADATEGYKVTNAMGQSAVKALDEIKTGGGFTAVGKKTQMTN